MVDENLPPAMAKSLAELFVKQHQFIHCRDKFGPGTTDITWINELNREGSWLILSADRRISKNKAEQTVFRNSKLIGFFFAPALQKAPLVKKMERLMAIWPTIEKQSTLVTGGSMFEIPIKGDRLNTI